MSVSKENNFRLPVNLIILAVVSGLVRLFLAGFIELGNDEVYYWTYALFPDLSHFDHPPMVGLVIQFFTLDLLIDHEVFVRLGPVVFGTVNTVMIFLIGKRLVDEAAGYYAALLYTGSIYCSVVAGIFILPDAPQIFFWLIALYLLTPLINNNDIDRQARKSIFWAGIVMGLGMLSKYTTAYLWFGALLYVLLFNRKWLKRGILYISVSMTLILFTPVLFWNWQTDFISFTFHSARVGFFDSGINPEYFITELAGQFFYNNPVNFILIISVLVLLLRKKFMPEKKVKRFLLLTGIPLIATFLFISLFRRTLPHWSGPGYLSLILLAAIWLRDKKPEMPSKNLPGWIQSSIILLVVVLFLAIGQIRYGIFPITQSGNQDITTEMHGWKKTGSKFIDMYHSDLESGVMSKDAVIFSNKWFPAAHFDYYVATPNNIKLYAINSLNEIHKYYWINQERGNIKKGTDAYFLTTSLYPKDPNILYKDLFKEILPPDTIRISRQKTIAKEVYVYRMKGLVNEYVFLTDATDVLR